MARVLVIEDEADLREVLEYNLTQAGHRVVRRRDRRRGLSSPARSSPDLVLLDLMLPDGSGTELCKTLRQDAATRGVRVVMLTAKGEEIDRVVGFELGADDYVVKPFSVRELLLRVQAVLRRVSTGETGETTQFGVLRVDRGAHRVWVGGQEVELTALEFSFSSPCTIAATACRPADALLSDVWEIDADVDDAHGRHPRQAPAREARGRREVRRDRARRRVPLQRAARGT